MDLEILVMRALERNPADRFESAEEMLEELEQFAFDTGLRISRLRLGRFVSTTMGTTRAVLVAQEEGLASAAAGEPAPEDLDFDKGLFGGGELDRRPPAPAVRQASAAEAIKRASAAIEELAADDDDEGATVEIRPAQQAQLRAHTVPAEEPAEPQVEAPREGSALIVTDDLVEEVTDLADEEPEILVAPPRPRSDQEVTRRQRADRAGGTDASDDLKRALEDISKDLEAAATSDRGRPRERLGPLVGGGRPTPPSPADRNQAASLPAVRDDDLERVDREGARPLDELEQSDIGAADLSSVEPEDDDSSILEPADAPDEGDLEGDLEETDGLDEHTIDLDLEGSDSAVVVREEGGGDGLDDPTLQEPGEKQHQPAPGGKKKRRRRKRRRS